MYLGAAYSMDLGDDSQEAKGIAYLSHDELTRRSRAEIGEMTRLETLCIYDNRINSLPDSMHNMIR